MPNPADDLRALLAACEAATGREWDGAATDIGEWIIEHGASVLALLDAAQPYVDAQKPQTVKEIMASREAIAAAVRRLTQETT